MSVICINNTSLKIIMDKEMYYRCLMSKEDYRKAIERILKTPHSPTLKYLREDGGNLTLGELREDLFYRTDVKVQANKVGEFCYTEEEFFHPVNRKCLENGLNLNAIEIDTKILKTFYSNQDFDAYSFVPVGAGLNIDGLTRISGGLYKIN